MKFIIIAELKSLFSINKPTHEFTVHSECMGYALNNFEKEFPEWEIINFN